MSAVDVIMDLRTGDAFKLRGRRFERSGYYNLTMGDGYMTIPVWNDRGREVLIKIKDTDHVEILR